MPCEYNKVMADRLSPERRSWNMSRVRSKDTSPERVVRSTLHKMGYRFRLNASNLPGKPDIVLKKYRTAVFIHGCFWHHHKNCHKASTPSTNAQFWEHKLASNVRRDKRIRRILRKDGWHVLTVWECQITKDWESLQTKLRRSIEAGSSIKRA